jgi:hypothetical protein
MRPFLLLVKALELRRLRVDRGQGQAAKVPMDRAALPRRSRRRCCSSRRIRAAT